MASNLKYSNGTRDAQQNGLITYAGSAAIIKIYDGTQPANANTAVSTQVLLVSLNISGTFGTDSNGTITLSAVTTGTAVATGTAAWFRITKSDGTTVVMDGTVGTSSADMILNNTSIATSQTVSISSGTIIRANQ
jgi:UDP-N-acetylmuramyl tripeptide synthase